ncbi:translesion DNA synthesis-associated protein ImuA [Curvibacter sp. APW13]|uniref:translesion DNA synthesis-associated protein ImuA n=1 Tax=Curvibacter sp. APW13 TaxID=3077236 RepID=UPI0028DFD9A8|nr:translesion DNA synthesis-associated protein ImuA [Curvibacter sp. APW13]MDT8989639.1 translesion DNA synthesis-associated protein ImuA [Curvibacter sp. APW13]
MSALPDAPTAASLAHLHAGLWRADSLSAAPQPVLASGHAALDAVLPGGGWPVGALCELLQPPGQHSEWRLLLPALARSGQGAVVLVAPPGVPFAPALAAQGLAAQRLVWLRLAPDQEHERLWAAEQALRCAQADAVLLWLPGPAHGAQAAHLRRLHLAAVQHGSLFFALREHSARQQASAAVLRLGLGLAPHGTDSALQVEVIKRRGPPLQAPVHLGARVAAVATVLAAGDTHVVAGTAHRA